MTRTIRALAELGGDYDAPYCDLWGCLHNGKQAYPAAVAALQAFRRGGGKVCLLTNAPRPQQYVAAQLQRMGVPDDAFDVIVSSGDAAQDAMFQGVVGRRVWHIGTEKDDGFFNDGLAESQVPRPSETMTFVDHDAVGADLWTYVTRPGDPNDNNGFGRVDLRHNEQAQGVFLDGHAQMLDVEVAEAAYEDEYWNPDLYN